MNNLFSHSPKELATDGFLAWFILEIENQPKNIATFFYNLGLCKNLKSVIDNISISKQEENTDLIIRYNVNGKRHQALFENKTYTTIHSNQLSKYKDKFPDFNHYKFLKLARVNYYEKKISKSNGYDVITSHDLYNALDQIDYDNEIVKQYKQYLTYDYINFINKVESDLEKTNSYKLFSSRQAQQFLIDSLHQCIDGISDAIFFKSSSNVGGSPWTQLDICKRENAYGGKNEYLFWRIDKRSGKYYLRLNQYSNIEKIYKTEKLTTLKILRKHIQPIFDKHKLNTSKPNNKGIKESEICILFFEDNTVTNIKMALPDLTKEIIAVYDSLKL